MHDLGVAVLAGTATALALVAFAFFVQWWRDAVARMTAWLLPGRRQSR